MAHSDALLGDIFAQAMPRFNNPVNLKRLITMIDEEDWSSMDVDVKGAAFEGLLEKAASEGKKGAGQFFTPRPLVQSIVRVMKPDPRAAIDCTIADPACGTGGFLMAAYEWLLEQTKGALERKDIKRIREKTYFGQELVPRPRRLALMNLFLHGLQPKIYLGDTIYEPDQGERYDVILTNPPFGTKGANQAPEREDFTVETSNKQLNFVQHILTILKPGAIETLAARLFNSIGLPSLEDGLALFFDFVASLDGKARLFRWSDSYGVTLNWWATEIPDLAGTGSNLVANVDADRRQKFLEHAARSRDRMAEARSAISTDTACRRVSEALRIQ